MSHPTNQIHELVHGIDLIEIARIKQAIDRHGKRFLRRVFSDAEITYCAGRVESLAARWAAKEAVAKLLGVGLRGPGAGPESGAVGLTEIETYNDSSGRPQIRLSGLAAQRAQAIGLQDLAISLSHTKQLAMASAIGWIATHAI
jgi:holo-[acyl-carrier protein] synthase